MDKAYFLITTYGRTATYWLASNLHKHPDIACSHGPTLSNFCLNYESPSVPDEKVVLTHKELDEFQAKGVDDLFDFLEAKKTAAVYGNVHGYSAHSIWLMNNERKIKRDVRIINLMRHPISRIESMVRRLGYEFSFNAFCRDRTEKHFKKIVSPDLVEYVQSSLGVDLALQKNRLFLYSLSHVSLADKNDMQAPYAHVPVERLVKDKEFFYWVFSYITKGKACMTQKYFNDVFSVVRMNDMNEEKTSFEQFAAWDGWMRIVFRLLMEEYNYPLMYEKLGYDFSYVGSGEVGMKSIIHPGRKSFIADDYAPVLIEENHRGYNIVKYKCRYYACSQEIGPLDLAKVSSEVVSSYCDSGMCILASSVDEAKEKINGILHKT